MRTICPSSAHNLRSALTIAAVPHVVAEAETSADVSTAFYPWCLDMKTSCRKTRNGGCHEIDIWRKVTLDLFMSRELEWPRHVIDPRRLAVSCLKSDDSSHEYSVSHDAKQHAGVYERNCHVVLPSNVAMTSPKPYLSITSLPPSSFGPFKSSHTCTALDSPPFPPPTDLQHRSYTLPFPLRLSAVNHSDLVPSPYYTPSMPALHFLDSTAKTQSPER